MTKLDQDLLYTILEATNDGFFDWHLTGDATNDYLSPGLKRMLGYADEELENTIETWKKLVFPDDLPITEASLDKHIKSKGEEPYYQESRYVHKDGTIVWIISRGKVIEWAPNGNPLRMIGTHTNITKSKESELISQRQLEEHGKLLETIVENIPNMIFLKEAQELRFELFNKAGEDLLGTKRDDLMGKNDYDLFPKEQATFFQSKDRDVLQGTGVKLIEEEPIDTAHGKRWLRTRKVPIRNSEGEPIFLLGISEDITEAKAQNEQKEERHKQILDILSSAPSCLKVIDQEGRLIDMNPQGLNLIEADSLEEVLNECVYDLIEDEYRKEFIEFNKRVCSGAKESKLFKVTGLKGTVRWMETFAAPYKLPNGDSAHIAITNDVTERIESEANREKQKALAHHHAKLASIGELAAGVGHEINNPLAIIKGYLSQISRKSKSEGLAPEKLNEFVEKIDIACNRIVQIVKGLRNFARSDEEDTNEFDPIEAIKESYSLIKEIYEKDGVTVSLLAPKDHHGLRLYGNLGKFQQVLLNLVSNARDATEQQESRQIEISCNWYDSNFEFSVRDNGSGISNKIIEKIFDPFFTTKEVNKGTGIGLSLVHNYVQELSGELNVDSREKKGSTFTITLPIRQPESQTNPNTVMNGMNSSDFANTIKGRVLIVDDEPEIRKCLKNFLEYMGATTEQATNGKEALEILQATENKYDLVITDMKMPVMDGRTLAAKIRETDSLKNLNIVLITGGINLDLEKFQQENKDMIDGYIYKPFTEADVYDQMQKLLRNRANLKLA